MMVLECHQSNKIPLESVNFAVPSSSASATTGAWKIRLCSASAGFAIYHALIATRTHPGVPISEGPGNIAGMYAKSAALRINLEFITRIGTGKIIFSQIFKRFALHVIPGCIGTKIRSLALARRSVAQSVAAGQRDAAIASSTISGGKSTEIHCSPRKLVATAPDVPFLGSLNSSASFLSKQRWLLSYLLGGFDAQG